MSGYLELSKAQLAVLDDLLSGLDDLNDAWSSTCMDLIENQPCFGRYDAYDVWLAWCHSKTQH